jgi:hypothetical protein
LTDSHPHPSVRVPSGASQVTRSGPRPFVTAVVYTLPDGRRVEWTARLHRKGVGRGRSLTWVIAMLFVIGSACFVVGPIPLYATTVGATATAITFFVGSLFFTTASYLSYLQVVRDRGARWFTWAPQDMGFWAVLVQLVGTVYFNVTTFAALVDVPPDMVNRVIWRPDAIGSVCFLVSSVIAFAEAGHRWWSWRPGERDWHITALNLWGSVFFGISAVGAYVQPGGDVLNAAWANGGTFLGAVCFLVASLLMLPEGRSGEADVGGPAPADGGGVVRPPD